MKVSHVTRCGVCQANICEHTSGEIEGLRNRLDRPVLLSDWQRLNEDLAKARREAACDVCLGVPPSGGGWCACGGSGKLADTLYYVRTVLLAAQQTNENLYAQHTAMQEHVVVNDKERNDALTAALCWEVRYNEQKQRADAAEKERDEARRERAEYAQNCILAEKERNVQIALHNSANIAMRREQSLRIDAEEERDENEREYNEVLSEMRAKQEFLIADKNMWKLNADTNETVAAANLSRAIAAEKQNETLKMLLKRTQEHRDAACRALEKAKGDA